MLYLSQGHHFLSGAAPRLFFPEHDIILVCLFFVRELVVATRYLHFFPIDRHHNPPCIFSNMYF